MATLVLACAQTADSGINTSLTAHVVATAVNPTAIRLELSVENPAEALVVGFHIYRDGILIATVTNTFASPPSITLR